MSDMYISAAMDDWGLDPYEMRIVLRIYRRQGDSACYESISSMADACKISVPTFQKVIKMLQEKNIISAEKFIGKASHLTVNPIEEWTKEPSKEITYVKSLPSKNISEEPSKNIMHPPSKDFDYKGNPLKVIHKGIPTVKVPKVKKSARTRLPHTALPDDWLLWTQAEMQWNDIECSEAFEGFKDFWLSKNARDPCKGDWFQTWRNACREGRVKPKFRFKQKVSAPTDERETIIL